MKIVRATLHERAIRLTKPYVLSFAVIERITSFVVEIETDEGGHGVGEAVALPGYGEETDDAVLAALRPLVPQLEGRDADDARQIIATNLPHAPFARSAPLTAIDWATRAIALPTQLACPLVAPIAASTAADMLPRCEAIRSEGYRVIKVKIGAPPPKQSDATSIASFDARAVRILLDELPSDMRLRFDANQGYTVREAEQVLRAMNHPRSHLIELVEQPIDGSEWDGFRTLSRLSPVPLMLDESIYDTADIDRAADVGATFIKLKLFKHRGVIDSLALADHALAQGLHVIVGNGVATDIANIAEACVIASRPQLSRHAGECNGFVKLESPMLAHPPRLENGSLIWNAPADESPWRLAMPAAVSFAQS